MVVILIGVMRQGMTEHLNVRLWKAPMHFAERASLTHFKKDGR